MDDTGQAGCPPGCADHTQVKQWEVGGAGPGAPQQFQVSSLGEVIPPALVHMPNQASGLVGAASQGTRGGCMWCWSSREKQGGSAAVWSRAEAVPVRGGQEASVTEQGHNPAYRGGFALGLRIIWSQGKPHRESQPARRYYWRGGTCPSELSWSPQ